MTSQFGMHLIGDALSEGEFEGGGNVIVRCIWGLWTPSGKAVSGTGGIGPCVGGFDVWACAAKAALETKAMLAGWRRGRESCTYQLPFFDDVGGAA